MARLERKPAEHVAIAGIIVQLLVGALAFAFSRLSGSFCIWALGWQALIAALVWMISLMRLRQGRLAEEERVEWERFEAERAAGGARGALFEEDELQAFAARNRLQSLEKYVCPVISVLVVLLLATAVLVAFLSGSVAKLHVVVERAAVTGAVMAGLTFVLFLIAMYALGMSRQAEWRSLRAGGSYMMLSTAFGFASVASLAMGSFGVMRPDRYIAWVMLGIMGLVALEILLNFVLDFYRPRVVGVEARPAYDSRFLGMVAEPGGILKTVAATLDYQFGFKVSQTWFYRFVERWIAPLVLIQLLTLYSLTCFVIVGPEQQAVVERWGVFQRIEEPGLFAKWPWPIDKVYRYPVRQINTLGLGHTGRALRGERILWTEKHYDMEYETMVATKEMVAGEAKKGEVPVNLLVAALTVRYKISDVKRWHYNTSDPEKLLKSICNREMSKYLAGVDLFDFMGPARLGSSETLRELMQAAADAVPGRKGIGSGLGMRIVAVGLEQIHPPVERDLPRAFHEVVSAGQEKETTILKAEVEAIGTRIKAVGTAERTVLTARAKSAKGVADAEAEALRFRARREEYRTASARTVLKAMEYFDALVESMTDARKFIIGVQGLSSEHIRLNLEDIFQPDISGLGEFESDQTEELEREAQEESPHIRP